MAYSEARPLAVALVLERDVPDWQWRIIDKLCQEPNIALAARLDAPCDSSRSGPPGIATAILALDRALFARARPYPRQSVARRVEALPVRSAANAPPGCDLVLNLADAPLPVETLWGVRHGEWRLSVSASRAGLVDWTGFEEARSGAPACTIAILERHAERTEPRTVASARYSTKVSATRTGAFAHEKSALLVLRALRELMAKPEDSRPSTVEGRAAEPGGDAGVVPFPPPPSTRQAISYAQRLVGALALRCRDVMQNRLGRDRSYWQLAVGEGAIDHFEPSLAVDLPRLEKTMADPFLFSHDGGQYIFYEAHPGGRGPAWIAVARLEGDTLVPLGTALRRSYHLSFPYVFRDGDRIFMLPETQQNNRLEVWRCVEFPLRWELHATALEGRFPADSVLFQHDGYWWLASNLSDHHSFQEHSSELYLFRVDGPDLRRLEAHKLNPVVIGSGTARNAGNIISRGGRLYRPSQINDRWIYGYGLNIMEIETLDLETFRERLLRRIEPAFRPSLLGVHHLSADAGRYVIDIRRPA